MSATSNGSTEPSHQKLLPGHRAVLHILTETSDPWLTENHNICTGSVNALLLMEMTAAERQETEAALRALFVRISGQHYSACPGAVSMRNTLRRGITELVLRTNTEREQTGQRELSLPVVQNAAAMHAS